MSLKSLSKQGIKNKTIVSSQGDGYIRATGGEEVVSGGYKLHIFKSSGTFSVTDVPLKTNAQIDFIVVGGGGAGCGGWPVTHEGGGGGAGGFVQRNNIYVGVSDHVITIGAGGTAPAGGSFTANPGNPSKAFGTEAIGGGGGVGNNNRQRFGGSGGGGWPNSAGNDGRTGQGNPGTNHPSGGGGGGAGQPGVSNRGGNGNIIFSVVTTIGDNFNGNYYVCGGGSGAYLGSLGGIGGGGSGTNTVGGSGNVNTGGGGAGGVSSGAFAGGAGGSGVVIIRYLFENYGN